MNLIPVTRVHLAGDNKPSTMGYRCITVLRTMNFRHVKCKIVYCTRFGRNEPLPVLHLYNSWYQTVIPFKPLTFFFCIQNKQSEYILSSHRKLRRYWFFKDVRFFVFTCKFSISILIDFAQQCVKRSHIFWSY